MVRKPPMEKYRQTSGGKGIDHEKAVSVRLALVVACTNHRVELP
jgi:hypothetical protein